MLLEKKDIGFQADKNTRESYIPNSVYVSDINSITQASTLISLILLQPCLHNFSQFFPHSRKMHLPTFPKLHPLPTVGFH